MTKVNRIMTPTNTYAPTTIIVMTTNITGKRTAGNT